MLQSVCCIYNPSKPSSQRCAQGVCFIDKYAVFCTRALPGERVRARITNSRRRYALAVKLETLRPSPDAVFLFR